MLRSIKIKSSKSNNRKRLGERHNRKKFIAKLQRTVAHHSRQDWLVEREKTASNPMAISPNSHGTNMKSWKGRMEWKEARGRRRKPKLCPTFTALNQLVLRVQRNIIKRHSQNLRLITSASKMISRNIFTNIDIRPKLFYMLSTTERDQEKMPWRKKVGSGFQGHIWFLRHPLSMSPPLIDQTSFFMIHLPPLT